MQLEFNETDFRPITPDQQMLSCISNWCKKQLDNLQSRQQKILKSSKDAELSDEQNYYSSVSLSTLI
ncbi:unnamed protein product [Trichobilharzia regenti]|nr:unnamed protein product [Trichobilharzia regenti]